MGTIRELTRKDGSKTYHAEVRLKGYPDQRDRFRTRSAAKKWIQDTESAIRDGRHFKTTEAKSHTVGEMIDRFVNQWLPKFPERLEKQTALLFVWKEKYGYLLLADFTPAVIAEFRDSLLAETTVRGTLRSPSTVNRYLSAMGSVLSVAMKEWGWIEDSPMRKIKKPSEAPGRERFLSLEEKDRLLEACKESRNTNLYPMVAISLILGVRYGELAGLRWGDIDWEQRKITLWRTKNGDNRILPLTAEVEDILKALSTFGSSAEKLIFQSKNRQVGASKVSVRGAFEGACKRADINNFVWHDLRHSAASYMAMGGATQGELMAILGHRSPAMTRRYAHYSQDHLRNMLERTKRI